MKNLLEKLKREFLRLFFGEIYLAKKLGVKLGNNCRLIGKIGFGSEPFLVTIGSHVSITASNFVTHDGGVWVFREEYPNLDVISPITIGNNVFIGTGCIILPGTVIEDNVVIGAGSVIKGHLPKNHVYAGIPAKKIKSIADYKESSLKNGLHFNHDVKKVGKIMKHFNIKSH